jgi:hypothetical protein
MKVLPGTRDEWVALVIFPFKGYVAMGVPVLLVGRFWFRRHNPPYIRCPEATYGVCQGYFLCVVALLLGALVQAMFCRRGDATRTLLFLGLALLILTALYPWGMFG